MRGERLEMGCGAADGAEGETVGGAVHLEVDKGLKKDGEAWLGCNVPLRRKSLNFEIPHGVKF